MTFDIATYRTHSEKLDLEDIDFGSFRDQPLSPEALRCLRYMHDVENHTVCYLRDVLVTRAHRDPDLTSFLTLWNYEEFWHGDAIGRVLAATGPFMTGYLVTALGSFGRAASAVSLIYLLGLLILPFAPETKGRPLPP